MKRRRESSFGLWTFADRTTARVWGRAGEPVELALVTADDELRTVRLTADECLSLALSLGEAADMAREVAP